MTVISKRYGIAMLVLASIGVLLWASDSTDDSGRIQENGNADIHEMKWVEAALLHKASASPRPTASGPAAAKTTGGPLIMYQSRQKLGVSVQAALNSRDPVQLHYAKIYISRCSTIGGWGSGNMASLLKTNSTSPRVRDAVERFDAMCDRELMNQEFARLSTALNNALNNISGTSAADAFNTAAQRGDGELLLENYLKARGQNRATPFDNIGECSTSNPMQASICDMAVLSAICSELECDYAYHLARFCGQFHHCQEETMDEQIDAISKAAIRTRALLNGASINVNWATLRKNAQQALRMYASTSVGK